MLPFLNSRWGRTRLGAFGEEAVADDQARLDTDGDEGFHLQVR